MRGQTIFYGICGEGFGHAYRASAVIPSLLDAGYHLVIFSSAKVNAVLRCRHPECEFNNIPWLRFAYKDNRLQLLPTVWSYWSMAWWGPREGLRCWKAMRRHRPVACISDYEPVVVRAAAVARVPVITLDHQQALSLGAIEQDLDIPRGRLRNIRFSNRMTYGKPVLRITSSFYRPSPRSVQDQAPAHFLGPLFRPEVLARTPTQGSHVVVYQTSESLEWLDAILDALPGEKRVYGHPVEARSNVVPRAHDSAAFLNDLATCRFFLSNGGHTAISEALQFGKPVISLPVRGQIEQEVNARYLQKLGFGVALQPKPGQVPDFASFLSEEDAFRRNMADHRLPPGNDEAIACVLEYLREHGAATT